MKALILGAGYGTRLRQGLVELEPLLQEKYRPLIEGKPKPLIPIAGKPLIEYLLEKIEKETDIKKVYVVTNDSYYALLQDWLANSSSSSLSTKIINDRSLSNEKRLGVLKDIYLGVQSGGIDDDWFILAGDTLLEMDFGHLVSYFRERKRDVISVYEEERAELHRRGVVVVDNQERIINFLEKPKNPPTNLAAPIAYLLTEETIRRLPEFLGKEYRQEDNLIERLVRSGKHEIYSFRFEKRYDIGTMADWIAVNDEFSRRLKP